MPKEWVAVVGALFLDRSKFPYACSAISPMRIIVPRAPRKRSVLAGAAGTLELEYLTPFHRSRPRIEHAGVRGLVVVPREEFGFGGAISTQLQDVEVLTEQLAGPLTSQVVVLQVSHEVQL